MGCLFSKSRSSLIHKNGEMPPKSSVQRLDQTNNNGIMRVPKPNHGTTDAADRNGHIRLQIKPPPPGPPPSPPLTSPRPILTAPRTPEDEKQIHYSERFRPVSPAQSKNLNVSRSDQQSSLTVSDVSLKPTILNLKRTSSTRREEDLALEDLNSDVEDDGRLSINRYRDNSRLNPPTTDILLPRRKDTKTEPIKEPPITKTQNNSFIFTDKCRSDNFGMRSRRNDTPIPNHMLPKNTKKTCKASTINMILEDVIIESKDEIIIIADETNDIRNKHEANHDKSRTDFSGNKNETSNNINTHIAIEDNDSLMKPEMDNRGVFSPAEINVQTDNTFARAMTPKKLFEDELEKKRQKRKRKHAANTKQDYLPGKLSDKENASPLPSLFNPRPFSGASTCTLDSRQSYGSNNTLNNLKTENASPTPNPGQYSYIENSSTPISFKSFAIDINGEKAEIIDMEGDEGDMNNDSWLEDDKPHGDKQIDAWYGVKPYEVMKSAGEYDKGMISEVPSGHSSSEKTKQKLLYSRFSRRPQSESVLRDLGKPPLPPGALRKFRPASDTGRRTLNNSRYFTTDLDIH